MTILDNTVKALKILEEKRRIQTYMQNMKRLLVIQ